MWLGRLLIWLVGVTDVAAGAALLIVPQWFYDTVGTFPPFNRHYLGDAGAFLLPIGVGLILGAVDPVRYRTLILLGLGASWIHAANHLYDGLSHPGDGRASLLDAASIIGLAAALTAGALLTRRVGSRGR